MNDSSKTIDELFVRPCWSETGRFGSIATSAASVVGSRPAAISRSSTRRTSPLKIAAKIARQQSGTAKALQRVPGFGPCTRANQTLPIGASKRSS